MFDTFITAVQVRQSQLIDNESINRSGTALATIYDVNLLHTEIEGGNVAVMRDRLRILGALLAAAVLGLGPPQASAGVVKKKTAKKKTKKKATKKKAKKKATKKKAKKKATKKKAKKKAKRKTKKKGNHKVTRVSEPGSLALMGAGLAAAGVAHKLGRRRKKQS